MRKVILLLLVVALAGFIWYAGKRRYPFQRVTSNGKAYEVMLLDRQCDGPRLCVAQVAFLTSNVDTASLIREGQGLLQWVEAKSLEPGDRGAHLIALKPGFLRLLPPKEAHGLIYGMAGKGDWQYLGQKDLAPELKKTIGE